MCARALVQQGRMEDALKLYDEVLSIDPEFALADFQQLHKRISEVKAG